MAGISSPAPSWNPSNLRSKNKHPMSSNSNDLNKIQADLAHERMHQLMSSANNHTIEQGFQAIKAGITINGGAAIALMALAGNLSGKIDIFSQHELIYSSLKMFISGVALSASSAGFSYCINFLYLKSMDNQTWDYVHPYIHPTTISKLFESLGLFLHVFTALLVFSSYGLFVHGALQALAFSL